MANGKEGRGIATPEKGRAELPAFWPDDFERLMGRFLGRPMRGFWRMRPPMWHQDEWLPDMDMFEEEGKVVVRLDLPGMKREDIDVAVEGDMLVVRGQRQEDKEIKEENYYCAERAPGAFYRSIRIPEGTSPDAIEAAYKDGVLEVRLPRPVTAEPKKLKVSIK
jgi:HSP20 family molecular chaperone IbpA